MFSDEIWIPPFITYVRDPIEIKQSCQQMVGLLNLSQFMENARHPLLHVPKGRTEMDKRPKRHFWLQRLQKLRSEFFKRTLCKCEKKGPFFFLQGKHQLVIRLPYKALGQDLEKKEHLEALKDVGKLSYFQFSILSAV